MSDYPDLIADDREPSQIWRQVERDGFKVSIQHLECADYITPELNSERKTYSDLWNALSTRRIWDQLIHMKKYNEENGTKSIIALIGSPYEIIKRVGVDLHDNVYAQITGFMLSSFESFNIPVFQFDNDSQFVKMLELQIKKQGKPASYKPIGYKKKDMNKLTGVKSDMFSAVPGIGRAIGDYLAENFTIYQISQMNDEELCNLSVNGRKIGNKVLNVKKAILS